MHDRRLQFKVFSRLFQYPDEDFMKGLPDVQAVIEELPAALGKKMEAFISAIRAQPPLRIQESYTNAFYLSAKTTLNMTYHRWGNGEKRALALARLEHVYTEAGYERTGGELPDFLPLILEFLSVNPDACGLEVVRECLSGIAGLSDRLQETEPAYALLLDALTCFLSDRVEEDVHRSPEGGEERAKRTDPSGHAPPEQGECHGTCP